MPDSDEPVVEVINPDGRAAVVLVCEHASNHIPTRYDGLGLAPDDWDSHAAWDIGAQALAAEVSARFDAPLVVARVSRLVYDCNRPPEAASAFPERSERIEVPGNRALDATAKAARTDAVYRPFCRTLAGVIAGMRARSPVIVTIHSFTPVYFGARREVELGLLHDDDARLAKAMFEAAGASTGLRTRLNEPYGPQDGVTHTLRLHALANHLLNVMVEVRNDLIPDARGVEEVTPDLVEVLRLGLIACGRVDALSDRGTVRA